MKLNVFIVLLCIGILSCGSKNETKMIDLEGFIPNLKLDVRYSTAQNFTKKVIYDTVRVFLVDSAAYALKNVALDFEKQGIGIVIFDAYRPLSVQKKLWEMFPDPNFVADPKNGSRHNRGAAVDLSLYDLTTGLSLEMPTDYDDFTEKAAQSFMDLPEQLVHNRNLLQTVMEKHGFVSLDSEWWHYDFRDWNKYPVLNLDFKQITKD